MDREPAAAAATDRAGLPHPRTTDDASVPARVGAVVGRASAGLRRGAEELRQTAGPRIREELAERIRVRPLLSLGIAVIAGFLLGRALRD
ncbi:MAG TPA: hypothetical protein VK939_01635 [Longimicrobiales bacterium]|nr:hypothetical protein [Longimicrobiales bacterium]